MVLSGAGGENYLTCRQRRKQNRKRRAFPPAYRQHRRQNHKQQIFYSNRLSLKAPFSLTSISFLEHFSFLDFIVAGENKEKKYAQIYYLVTFL